MLMSVICPEVAVGAMCTERTAPFGHQFFGSQCFSHSPASFLYPVSHVRQAPGPQMPMGF